MSRNANFRCTICGRYISYQDISDDKVQQDFTPDTEYTTEQMEMTHLSCIKELDHQASKYGWRYKVKS